MSRAPLWWSDVDGDGDRDVLALVGTGRPVLLVQESAGVFTDVTAARGLEGLDGVTLVGWCDLDADGRADLYLGGAGQSPRLWRNVGALFEPLDGTGLEHGEVDRRIAFGDLDGDDRDDLLVESDVGTLIYRNLGDWRFERIELPLDEAGLVWTIGTAVGGAPSLAPVALDDTGAVLPGPVASTPDAGPSAKAKNPPAILPGGEIPAASAGTTSPEPILITCLPSMQDQASSGCVMASSLPTLGMLYPLGPELNVDGATGYVGVNTTTPLYRVHVVEPTDTAIFGQGALTGVRGDANLGGGSGGRYGGYFTASGGSNNVGVFGQSSIGAFGNGSSIGTLGTSGSSVGVGVKGQVSSASGATIGVLGETASSSGFAVRGHATATSGNPFGVMGVSDSNSGVGVLGAVNTGSLSFSPGSGVMGFTGAPSGVGVSGKSIGEDGIGVQGYADVGNATGVYGFAEGDTAIGVRGETVDGVGVRGSTFVGTGVHGVATLTGTVASTGVFGESHATGGAAAGVRGRLATAIPDYDAGGVVGSIPGGSARPSGVLGLVEGAGSGYGVSGKTAGVGPGVYGQSNDSGPGAYATFGVGVAGIDARLDGLTAGVYGRNSSTDGSGVEGHSDNHGVFGLSYGGGLDPAGVCGVYLGSEHRPGVKGESEPGPNLGTGGDFRGGFMGVSGLAEVPGVGYRYGGYFRAANGATANIGVYGEGSSYAGFFNGNVHVNGSLSKSAGSFKIDHPLDPENKYLVHSFVESPDMMNVYNGNVLLDSRGEAWVELPEWFEALNEEFRYQLTCIGGFAPVHVADEIRDNRFRIAGGRPGLKVSWQVTGIRDDAYARAHRLPVELDKGEQRGFYLHPELHGAGPEKNLTSARLFHEKPEVPRRAMTREEREALAGIRRVGGAMREAEPAQGPEKR